MRSTSIKTKSKLLQVGLQVLFGYGTLVGTENPSLYDRIADRQYTRQLLFSSVFQLMNRVVFKIQPSLHVAYQDNKEQIATSLTAVYDKLSGIDTRTSRALVEETARQMGESVSRMNGTCQPWLPGHRIKVLDGNCIEATEHRLKALRSVGGGAPHPPEIRTR